MTKSLKQDLNVQRKSNLLRRALLLGVSTLVIDAASTAAFAQAPVDQNAPTTTSGQDGSATPRELTTPNNASTNATSAQTSGAPNGSATSPEAATANRGESAVSEVVVTGLRGSLQRNLNIKQNSVGIVDAISAEDIGKFPDNNIAEAMQRIPGVTISRGPSSLGGTPTSTGDATEITVRGFGPSFNETLFDDRQTSTGTSNRGFDFSTVGADFVGEVDVLKTPDATLSAGAIGATINIKDPKPFDHPGLRIVGSGSTTYSPEDGHATPNGGVLFSDTFGDDKFGFLADFAYSDHKTRGNHIDNQGWEGTQIAPCQLAGAAPCVAGTPAATASRNAWFIQDYGVYQEYTNNSREDARLVFQWKPVDNFLITLNDDFNRERVTQDQNGYSVWFNAANLTNVVQDKNGTITSFGQPNSPTDFQGQINKEILENNEYGFNAKWDVNSSFTVVFDADRADSWLNPQGQYGSYDADVGYAGSASTLVGIDVPGGGQLPYPTSIGPNGNASQFLNSSIIGSHVFPIFSQQNHDQVNQIKIQGNWTDDNFTVRFGAQYVSDHEHLDNYNDQVNNDWQAYSGYGPASGSATGVAIPANLLNGSFNTSGFIPGYSSSGLPADILKINPYQIQAYLQGLGNPQTKTIPGFNPSVTAYNGQYQIVQQAGSHQVIGEDTIAAFLSASEKTHVAGMPLTINVGLREELTRTSSAGLGQEPTALVQQLGDPTSYQTTFGPTEVVRTQSTYSYLLPNLDIGLNVTDQIKVRMDISRTLSRPPLGDLTPVTVVPTSPRVGQLTATGGNPDLLPYLSDNFDLGVEWYYQKNSYISLDGYVKHVTNFIVAGSSQQTINGVTIPEPVNGSTPLAGAGSVAQFTVSTNVNGPQADVYGMEFALQHVFWDTGFGFQFNTTVVGTNKTYDPNNLSVSGFAVTGLADSANIVGFYDKYGFQARLAVNWRDSYLDHFGQQQNGSLFGTEPTFVNSNTTVDFSTSYDITKQLSIYGEALNLTDSGYSTRGRFSNQFLDIVSYGRRFTVGAHFRY